MHRRHHPLIVTLVVLLAVTGWSRASLSPLAGAARAPVGTPGPSPLDLYPHRPPLSAHLPDHLDRRAPGSMMRPPQTVTHPALVGTLIARAAMADPALPA
jgi:hypothetical protein